MKETFRNRISKDLKESRINWNIVILFVPIAFITYIFHESGHWIVGELLGNEMTLGLNNSAPKSGFFINESHALWSAIGGPFFTMLQAFLFLIISWITKSIFAFNPSMESYTTEDPTLSLEERTTTSISFAGVFPGFFTVRPGIGLKF